MNGVGELIVCKICLCFFKNNASFTHLSHAVELTFRPFFATTTFFTSSFFLSLPSVQRPTSGVKTVSTCNGFSKAKSWRVAVCSLVWDRFVRGGASPVAM